MNTRSLYMGLKRIALALTLLAGAALPAFSSETYAYDVTWDTSTLKNGYYDTPLGYGGFYVVFTITNGGNINHSSSVELSNFDLGTGHPLNPPYLDGGATGALTGSILLTDSQFANTFAQVFQPGDKFNFRMRTNVSPDNGEFPDLFSLQLYVYADVPSPVGTLDPNATNVFLRANMLQGPLSFETYDAFASMVNDSFTLPAPVLTQISTSAVPEPAALWLLGSGLITLGLLRRRL